MTEYRLPLAKTKKYLAETGKGAAEMGGIP